MLIRSKFLFSHLILCITQWTSAKNFFDLDKMHFLQLFEKVQIFRHFGPPFAPVFPGIGMSCDVDSGTCDYRLDSFRCFLGVSLTLPLSVFLLLVPCSNFLAILLFQRFVCVWLERIVFVFSFVCSFRFLQLPLLHFQIHLDYIPWCYCYLYGITLHPWQTILCCCSYVVFLST